MSLTPRATLLRVLTCVFVWSVSHHELSADVPELLRPFLQTHCLDCHSGDEPKGNLRLDVIATDFDDAIARKQWHAIYKRVQAGEMPPKESPRPPEAELTPVLASLRGQLREAEERQRAITGRVVLRRLNRIEYENTVRDLLGISASLQELLPLDSSADGFDNVGEALHLSSFLMERYLEAVDTAFDVAIANLPQPPLVKQHFSLTESHQVKLAEEKVYRISEDGRVVMFSSSPWNSIVLSPLYPHNRGDYRIRISTSAVQSGGKPVTYRLDAGEISMTGKPHLVGYFDAPADETRVLEFVDTLEARHTARISPYGLAGANVVHPIGADKYEGPGLAVDWVEVEGPLHDVWPPESHRRIFGDLPQQPAPNSQRSDRVEVTSDDPVVDAERILKQFTRRAFRRPVTNHDVAPFLKLVEEKLAEGRTFEQAVRVALTAVLMSPDFLFLKETPGRLDDFALANRLSYFLWSSLPDEDLWQLAANRKLTGEDSARVLRDQVERMLNHPKAEQFTRNFVGQWLGLRDIDFTMPSELLYPEFDEMLKESMVREAELFFAELLDHDLSLTNFVASDFTMLNGRLAKHYGIPDVDGWEFRKVSLPEESHRGGVLTMAGVLKVTANGTSTSPVTRGAWVLERILGITPPRPPANIPALEPDIRGATTIREQLAKHRKIADCASCHIQIDPPGFALESFDVIGGYREKYRFAGWRRDAEELKIKGRTIYLDLKIDPTDTLPDGRAFQNIDEFKALLLADKDQLARALAAKLVIYATGGGLSEFDQPEIEAVVEQIRDKDYGFRSLVHAVVQSDLFRSK